MCRPRYLLVFLELKFWINFKLCARKQEKLLEGGREERSRVRSTRCPQCLPAASDGDAERYLTARYSSSLLAREERDVNHLTNGSHCKHLVKRCHRSTCSPSRCCGDGRRSSFFAPTANTRPGRNKSSRARRDAATFCVALFVLAAPGHGEFRPPMGEQLVDVGCAGFSGSPPSRSLGPQSRFLSARKVSLSKLRFKQLEKLQVQQTQSAVFSFQRQDGFIPGVKVTTAFCFCFFCLLYSCRVCLRANYSL